MLRVTKFLNDSNKLTGVGRFREKGEKVLLWNAFGTQWKVDSCLCLRLGLRWRGPWSGRRGKVSQCPQANSRFTSGARWFARLALEE
jgi:hypothetical protein